MLTYELKKMPGLPLYESLYRQIRADILSGHLAPGQKLPSKRALAANLEVSKITVETAYNQLAAEGFIAPKEKVGYFVEQIRRGPSAVSVPSPEQENRMPRLDLTGSTPARFPFSVWSKLQREVMSGGGERLLQPMVNIGCTELRQAIADHLAAFRGMQVSPDHILVGAGTDFLYNLLVQLLGRDRIYALEEPGYDKTRKIFSAAGARCISARMNEQGVDPDALDDADVLHLSPSHHFPTGLITSMQRRRELLNWAGESKWIIEDDYDSEFRFNAHPMRTLQSMDTCGRVIYMNSFSKSLAPSIRIGYLVLPEGLMRRYQEEFAFYSCTVPSFEQHTLALFLSRGYFEKHINRMRKHYRQTRDQLVQLLEQSPFAPVMTMTELDAGLHFLLKIRSELPEQELLHRIEASGIRVRLLSDYYHSPVPELFRNTLVINYAGMDGRGVEELQMILEEMQG